MNINALRNIAIIAHVDHGKTTLVDAMLQQSGTFKEHQSVQERAMDSNDLEKERGITILAKCTAVIRDDVKINIVDTPGHADFGGEVERILSMVDGVALLVDAAEGPLPQTKFVLNKALSLGMRPMVIINKIDRADARADEVLDEIFDLFVSLDAHEDQLEFPVLYASGRDGWAVEHLDSDERKNLDPLFDLIINHVPEPKIEESGEFKMLATTLESDPFMGRILTGKVLSGSLKVNQNIKALNMNGEVIERARASKLLTFLGLNRIPTDEAKAGDIIALAGFSKATVADTICELECETPVQAQPIDPPTISMTFSINDSPYAGRDGDKVTSRMIRDRLMKEIEGNVAIKIEETENKDAFQVSGRGELQLAVLIETMRREGFELGISRPRVIYKEDENGKRTEPLEEVYIDVDDEYSGVVVQKMQARKADLLEIKPSGHGKSRIKFLAPSRGLIGYQNEFLTDTRGTGLLNRIYHSYGPFRGEIESRHTGVLISNAQGTSVAFALWNLEDRGPLMIGGGVDVYTGMIVGEHTRSNDLEVNVLKGKKLTNMRASGTDENVSLSPPMKMTLEKALSYINSDELVEVTPNHLRLRKRLLDPNDRKRASRAKEE